MDVFYNRAMETDRNMTVVLLSLFQEIAYLPENKFKALDGMGATGIRGLRIAMEVPGSSVTINDVNPKALDLIAENIVLNGSMNVSTTRQDIRKILCEDRFDYVDVDPFGSPAPYVEYALHSLGRKGVLAITATDTATLFGSYPKTCLRRYDSISLRCFLSHEIGLRILLGYVIRKAASNDLCALPLLSYSHDHYYRAYFYVEKGAAKADLLLNDIRYLLYDRNDIDWFFQERDWMNHPRNLEKSPEVDFEMAGPLYSGGLIHPAISNEISKSDIKAALSEKGTANKAMKILITLAGEAEALPLFFCTHELGRKWGKAPPPMGKLLSTLDEQGITACRTHFSPTAIKLHKKHIGETGNICRIMETLFE
ncbi:MAG: tRNA (guanine(26)-N(2))-dimethyltransferase [Candidatus Thermoplasmatota archaeon]|nr:tRNA (guanine(26)-N(2))-dimethyltransferase [Candidatus Thermoplasmatota archaeon]